MSNDDVIDDNSFKMVSLSEYAQKKTRSKETGEGSPVDLTFQRDILTRNVATPVVSIAVIAKFEDSTELAGFQSSRVGREFRDHEATSHQRGNRRYSGRVACDVSSGKST